MPQHLRLIHPFRMLGDLGIRQLTIRQIPYYHRTILPLLTNTQVPKLRIKRRHDRRRAPLIQRLPQPAGRRAVDGRQAFLVQIPRELRVDRTRVHGERDDIVAVFAATPRKLRRVQDVGGLGLPVADEARVPVDGAEEALWNSARGFLALGDAVVDVVVA